MPTATLKGAKVTKCSLPPELNTFAASAPIILEPMVVYDPPKPIADAKGSLTNEQLRKLAEKRVPPESWFEGDEEQVF